MLRCSQMLDIDRGIAELKRPQLRGYGETIISLLKKRDERISQTRDLTHILGPYWDKINSEPLLDPVFLFNRSYVPIIIHNDFWPADPKKYITAETWDYCAFLIRSSELLKFFEIINPGQYQKFTTKVFEEGNGYWCENTNIGGENSFGNYLNYRPLQIELFLSKNLDQFNLQLRFPQNEEPITTVRAWQ